jgi:hypothetical protein
MAVLKIPDLTKASAIASYAATLVSTSREATHGDKIENFNNIAALWSAWIENRHNITNAICAHDVGIMLVLMKAARTLSGSVNLDDYVDMAGYAACAGEVVQEDFAGTGQKK